MNIYTTYSQRFSNFILITFTVGATLVSPWLTAVDTISINSVTGAWSNISGGQNVTGIGTNQINWGAASGQNSGYLFVGSAPPIFSVSPNTAFDLGQFTHFNFPIPSGSGITGARLTTTVNLSINGSAIPAMTFAYDFLHNETPNVAPCQAGSVSTCDDIVQITNNQEFSSIFNVGGQDYTIKITGFDVNGSLFDQFMTQENKTNEATLKAIVTVPDVAVPEPSTYLLMGSLLGVTLFCRRLRKASNNHNHKSFD